MIWGFVDYENLGSLKGIDFSQYEKLYIFCGPKNPNIKLGNTVIHEFLKIEVIKLSSAGLNNLDFHIAYYLGKFSETAAEHISFHVISNDNGFNGLVSHINTTGRLCQKVTPNKGKTALSASAELAADRLRNTDGRKRPRKEQPLINWIASQCRSINKKVSGKKVLDELMTAGFIENENSVIKYKLGR